MKLKAIITLFLISVMMTGYSQVKPFRFGVKVAPDLSWLSPDANGFASDGSKFGFSWGFISDIALTENYFVKTGFSLDYLGGKLKYTDAMEVIDGEPAIEGVLFRNYSLRYLEIPVTIKMRTNKFGNSAYFGEIGFGGGFNLRAKSKDEFSYGSTTTPEVENDVKDEVNFMKASLIVGAGMEYFVDESTSILVSLNFNNGLTDIFNGKTNSDPPIEQKAVLYFFQLNVGVMF
ncbi:MAG: PorT family protein [Bacteroidales bacterium]|nr:PorT family protein [Bacteroidales bacterium]